MEMHMTIYNNFLEMSDAILAHVAVAHHQIVESSDPRARLIGFRSVPDDEQFYIPLIRIKAYEGMVGMSDSEHAVLRNCLKDFEGRKQMAEAFSRGERIWQRPPSDPV